MLSGAQLKKWGKKTMAAVPFIEADKNWRRFIGSPHFVNKDYPLPNTGGSDSAFKV